VSPGAVGSLLRRSLQRKTPCDWEQAHRRIVRRGRMIVEVSLGQAALPARQPVRYRPALAAQVLDTLENRAE
jgi:hypothetical protein